MDATEEIQPSGRGDFTDRREVRSNPTSWVRIPFSSPFFW